MSDLTRDALEWLATDMEDIAKGGEWTPRVLESWRDTVRQVLAAPPPAAPGLREALSGLLHANAKAAGHDPDGISAVILAEQVARRALAKTPGEPKP